MEEQRTVGQWSERDERQTSAARCRPRRTRQGRQRRGERAGANASGRGGGDGEVIDGRRVTARAMETDGRVRSWLEALFRRLPAHCAWIAFPILPTPRPASLGRVVPCRRRSLATTANRRPVVATGPLAARLASRAPAPSCPIALFLRSTQPSLALLSPPAHISSPPPARHVRRPPCPPARLNVVPRSRFPFYHARRVGPADLALGSPQPGLPGFYAV